MSTDHDSPKPDRFRTLANKNAASDPENARSTAEAELEKKLAFEQDARKEDRFVFMIILVVIFNAWGLQNASTWTLPLLIGILQLFALVVLARRFGVQEIQYWLNQFLAHMGPGSAKTERPTPQSKVEPKPAEPITPHNGDDKQ
ncbi:hypothetical protein HaloA020_29370 [Halomonas sp. A020]|uniref:hypothetical protein n=1 Tax=Halomonas sp. A020 TaxID=2717374 RepID=UPI002490E33E|nr:hypothetical protein [Halomonas sp. A020]BCB62236.1 hypothetical protein HaloA020_29370 [Halomonas sp. A020]